MKVEIILDSSKLRKKFNLYSKKYESLTVAVAWAGNPLHSIPISYIEHYKERLKMIVGIGFNQTHPEAIRNLMSLNANIKVFKKEEELFHPKIYLFENDGEFALLMGSSNLTFSGFNLNYEGNISIEGKVDDISLIHELKEKLELWHSAEKSFTPSEKWLAKYEKDYENARRKKKENKIKSDVDREDEISIASWLSRADWSLYSKKVKQSFSNRESSENGYKFVLNNAKSKLALPWKVDYLLEKETRKLIGGRNEFGWFGNTVASGKFAGLLNSGELKKKKIIINSINEIAAMNHPINFKTLEKNLIKLTNLGFTMKAWGRLLCLARPDLYCSVSAPSLRKNLGKTLGVTQASFSEVEGYLLTIKHLHSSPWFNSEEPTDVNEKYIWENKVAFIDAIFY